MNYMNIGETGNKKPEINPVAAQAAVKPTAPSTKPPENVSEDAARVSVSLQAKEEAPAKKEEAKEEAAAAPVQNPAIQKYKQVQDSLVS